MEKESVKESAPLITRFDDLRGVIEAVERWHEVIAPRFSFQILYQFNCQIDAGSGAELSGDTQ